MMIRVILNDDDDDDDDDDYDDDDVMMMMVRKFILSELVGDCSGRLRIDISDHTHFTYVLQWRCLVIGYFAFVSSLP